MTQTTPEPADDTAATEAAPAAPTHDVAALEAQVADLKDKLLRTLAEMENLRRRTEREVVDAKTYGIAGFARDMLNVADNLRRALEATGGEIADAAKPLIEGVELTERELAKAFERHGVRRIEPRGEKFDPHRHQAMFEVPDPNVPSGMVTEVVQAGYVIGDRVLRPALVGVSKGGPKAAPVSSEPAAG